MIRRPPRSTLSSSSAASDVYKRQELKYVRWGSMDRKITLNFDLGIDHHTAASAAYVSKSAASQEGGTRVYPSADWQIENSKKRTTFGLGAALSFEYTYHSYSPVSYTHLRAHETRHDLV